MESEEDSNLVSPIILTCMDTERLDVKAVRHFWLKHAYTAVVSLYDWLEQTHGVGYLRFQKREGTEVMLL